MRANLLSAGVWFLINVAPLMAGDQIGARPMEDRIRALEEALPDRPAVIDELRRRALAEYAATQRYDAARLLIKAFVLSEDAGASDEIREPDQMLPSLGLLDRHYGDAVVPLLYAEGIAAAESWQQSRVALAIRHLASPAQRHHWNEILCAPGAHPRARLLRAHIEAKEITIAWPSAAASAGEAIDNALKSKGVTK